MSGRLCRIVGALTVAGFGLVSPNAVCAAPDGRALYQGFATFTAGSDATRTHLPPALTACARCHGPEGRGSREGGVVVPPLAWSALTAPRGGLPAFDAAAVGRAITDGIGRDGHALGPVMPRYVMQPAEAEALVDYLRRLGTEADTPPGVSRTTIRVGTLLPLSGTSGGLGQAVLAGLDEVLSQANLSGVHGRQIELHAVDTVPAGPLAAARTLLDTEPYAVIGGMWSSDDTTVGRLLSARHVSKVGSLVPRSSAADLDDWDVDLLPPLAAQQGALAADLKDRGDMPRYGLRLGGFPPADAVAGVRWFDAVTPLVAALGRERAPGVVALGLGAAPAVMPALPPGWTADLVLPFPALLLDHISDSPGGPELWTDLGRAAGRLAVELLARAGRQLSERAIVAAVPGLGGFEPLPTAPVRFTPGRRYAWDAAVVSVPAAPNRPIQGE